MGLISNSLLSSVRSNIKRSLFPLSTTFATTTNTTISASPNPNPRNPPSRTPLEKQFETWIDRLKPGFTSSDVVDALRSQSDPDLALDIFRWTSRARRDYRHDDLAYRTILQISISGRRFDAAVSLAEEAVSGACSPSVPLYNDVIRFYCSRRGFVNRSFDLFRKMRSSDLRPTLDTYSMLLHALIRRFGRREVCYTYLPAVKSLVRQMKTAGVIPDKVFLNMVVKAYSMCLEMEEAIRVFKGMGLYGCEPDKHTYAYVVKGLVEKGRLEQGLGFYREMREKGFVPSRCAYNVLVSGLALERRFDEAVEVVFDMIGNSMSPDLLTYRTLLEEMCRGGREREAFELLGELKGKGRAMNEKTHSRLFDGLRLLCRDF
ncbi:Pentatricopeptide repeat-containing protein [Acorus calamus]|uniref:Pentatricopeptide repeat-containing protein n=1 Tax=Acorus calamus TaxID=4465 RepID=A0AAV9CYC9_ACOCL|nr:Pentatricopeptide repeat-containing protein [Acorus calamus]